MQLQRLTGFLRKAVDDYSMIDDNDHITAAVSGGKDSMTLLYGLHALRRFYPKKFDISAVTVDLGFADSDFSPVQSLCDKLEIPWYIVKSGVSDIVFNIRKEKNPCSLCAKLRKGALNRQAKAIGSNKVAYAHHKDDIIETMLLCLIFEGRFYSFSPKLFLDRAGLTLIRPMMYVSEEDINDFKERYVLPIAAANCPADGITRRQYAKELLRRLENENPGAKERMFRAILNGDIPGWPQKTPCISGR